MATRTGIRKIVVFVLLCVTAVIEASCGTSTGTADQPENTTIATVPPRTIQVDRQQEIDNVTITVHQVRLSQEETLVLYRIDVPDEFAQGPLKAPTIETGDETLRSNEGSGIEGWRVLEFPPLPAETSGFILNFNPFVQLNGSPMEVSIPLGDVVGDELPPAKGKEVVMDQLISVGTAQFRVTRMFMNLVSFDFTYEPVSDEAAALILAGPGNIPDIISATDDAGNSYTASGGGFKLEFDSGYPRLKSQTIRFDTLLQPGATRLDLHITALGTLGREPYRFEIQVP